MALSDESTDAQHKYLYVLLKDSGAHENNVVDMSSDIPHSRYGFERGMKTWDWIRQLTRGEASDVIKFLKDLLGHG